MAARPSSSCCGSTPTGPSCSTPRDRCRRTGRGSRQVITPKFAVSFDKSVAVAEQSVKNYGLDRTCAVFATGVEVIDSDTAQVLVAGSISQTALNRHDKRGLHRRAVAVPAAGEPRQDRRALARRRLPAGDDLMTTRRQLRPTNLVRRPRRRADRLRRRDPGRVALRRRRPRPDRPAVPRLQPGRRGPARPGAGVRRTTSSSPPSWPPRSTSPTASPSTSPGTSPRPAWFRTPVHDSAADRLPACPDGR